MGLLLFILVLFIYLINLYILEMFYNGSVVSTVITVMLNCIGTKILWWLIQLRGY